MARNRGRHAGQQRSGIDGSLGYTEHVSDSVPDSVYGDGLTCARVCIRVRAHQRSHAHTLPLVALHLLGPAIVLMVTWAAVLAPSETAAALAPVFPFRIPYVSSTPLLHWQRALPPHAANLTQAWSLGELEGRARALTELGAPKAQVDAVLRAAATALGLAAAEMSLEDLARARAVTDALAQDKGAVGFITGMFTFTNAIWLMSTLGIVVSILPFATSVIAGLADLAVKVWRNALSHAWRPALYVFTINHVAAVLQATLEAGPSAISDAHVFTTLTFALLVHGAFAFTLFQLGGCGALPPGNAVSANRTLHGFGALLYVPLATLLSSSLVGFFSIGEVFAFLGFVAFAMPGGYAFGFSNDDAITSSLIAAAHLIVAAIVVKISGNAKAVSAFAPYAAGAQTFGVTVYFLGLLIQSDAFFGKRNATAWRVTMATSLLMAIFLGNVLPMRGLSNTAYVFAFLCAMDLLAYASSGNLWAAIFLCSAFAWVGARYVHGRPEIIASLYQGAV